MSEPSGWRRNASTVLPDVALVEVNTEVATPGVLALAGSAPTAPRAPIAPTPPKVTSPSTRHVT